MNAAVLLALIGGRAAAAGLPAADALAVSTSSAAGVGAACGPDFSLEKALAAFGRGDEPKSWDASKQELTRASLEYYQCLAFAKEDPRACAPLAGLPQPEPHTQWDSACQGHYNEMELVRSFVTGGADFTKACPRALAFAEDFEEREFKPADIPEVCRILSESRDDIGAACRRILPFFQTDEQRGHCVPTFQRLSADPAVCSSFNVPEVRSRCLEYAAYRKARLAGDPALCGDSVLCRLFFDRDPKRCAVYEHRAQQAVCGRPSAPAAARPPHCGERFPIADLLRDLAEKGFPPQAEAAKTAVASASVDYLKCLSVARRDIGLCAPLKGLNSRIEGFNAPLDDFCESNYRDASFSRALIAGGPGLVESCREAAASSGNFKRDDVERVCALFVEHRGDPAALCAQLRPLYAEPAKAERCAADIALLLGTLDCSAVQKPGRRERCDTYAAFRGAHASGQLDDCGDRIGCRLMMGEGEERCEPLADAIRAAYCGGAP